MENILEIKNLSYTYHTLEGETPALDNISFALKEGEFLSVVGPSGCGKSTLLSIICGLLTPDAPSVFFQGKSLKENSDKIGYMLQHDHLFEWRTIYQNVLLGLEIQHKLSVKTKEKAKKLLETYGLKEFSNARPSELSGGMRQRAALIRTLALNPDILLLDEPFSALDYQTRLEVSDDIGSIIKEQKKTALLVTHDISEAISMGDQVVILSQRPATIKKIIDIHFSIPDRTPFTSRQAPEFAGYFNDIWEEIQ